MPLLRSIDLCGCAGRLVVWIFIAGSVACASISTARATERNLVECDRLVLPISKEAIGRLTYGWLHRQASWTRDNDDHTSVGLFLGGYDVAVSATQTKSLLLHFRVRKDQQRRWMASSAAFSSPQTSTSSETVILDDGKSLWRWDNTSLTLKNLDTQVVKQVSLAQGHEVIDISYASDQALFVVDALDRGEAYYLAKLESMVSPSPLRLRPVTSPLVEAGPRVTVPQFTVRDCLAYATVFDLTDLGYLKAITYTASLETQDAFKVDVIEELGIDTLSSCSNTSDKLSYPSPIPVQWGVVSDSLIVCSATQVMLVSDSPASSLCTEELILDSMLPPSSLWLQPLYSIDQEGVMVVGIVRSQSQSSGDGEFALVLVRLGVRE